MGTTVSRVLPQALDAEAEVIGTCLTDTTGQAVERALLMLRPDHFFRESHQLIFRAIGALHAQGTAVDQLTVAREMERQHTLHKIAGIDYRGFRPLSEEERREELEKAGRERIAEYAAHYPIVTRLPHHAKLIIEAWGKRRCIEEFTTPMKAAWNGATPTQVIRNVESALQKLHTEIEDEGDSQIVSSLDAAKEEWERVEGGGSDGGSVRPPFSFLDDLEPGRLYILGGYAKDGKTDVGISAAATACRNGVPTGMVTIEMPRAQMMQRFVAQFGVPYGPLQKRIVTATHRDAWERALKEISEWPLHFYDHPAADVADIARFCKLGRFGFLVVDHLHRISYEDAPNPRLKLGANVKQLAVLARTAEIPILLLAQLHRAGTLSDGFPRPTMQSFKESSTIEQEASALWAIYRKRDPDTGERTPQSQFLVLADRYGEDGVYDLHFNGAYQRFTETDWRHA